MRNFGADQAFEIEKLDAELPRLVGAAARSSIAWAATIRSSTRASRGCCTRCGRAPRAGVNAPPRIEDPGQIVHELRLHKEPRELESMRLAIAQTRRGHLACMKAGRPGAYEYELHGLLEREFRHGGGRGWGYDPIVGRGRERHRPPLRRQPRADPRRRAAC